MSLNEKEYVFTWIIENYSFCDNRENKYLCSPFFNPTNLEGDRCRIVLSFSKENEQSEEYISLKLDTLVKLNHGIKNTINMELCNVNCDVILAFDEKKGKLTEKRCFEYFKCKQLEFPKVLKTAELAKVMKKSAADVLIVRCNISTGNNPTDRNREKLNCIAKTTIVVEKASFILPLCFDGKSRRKFTHPEGLIFSTIFKAPEDDVLIEILISDCEMNLDYRMKCQISLLNCDKTVILSSCDFLFFDHESNENSIWHFPSFFKKTFLVDRKLFNCCTLKFDFSYSKFASFHECIEEAEDDYRSSSSTVSENPVILSLQNDLNAMLLNDKHADVQLRVDRENMSAHKSILASRSPVFSAMFDQDMIENQTGEISISDINADTMKLFLKFLYTGMLDELDCEKMLELLLAAEKYQVPSLKEKCSEYLLLHLDTDNVCDVVSVAGMVGHEILKAAAIQFIKRNAAKILGSPNWPVWIKKNVELGSEILCKLSKNLKRKFHSDA